MRFGQLEVRTIATLIASKYTLELPRDFSMEFRQMPTISPKHGLPMVVRKRLRGSQRTKASTTAERPASSPRSPASA
jgi:hypothetical protein